MLYRTDSGGACSCGTCIAGKPLQLTNMRPIKLNSCCKTSTTVVYITGTRQAHSEQYSIGEAIAQQFGSSTED
eukprot:13232-Heterococcus_DN1.PRE.6